MSSRIVEPKSGRDERNDYEVELRFDDGSSETMTVAGTASNPATRMVQAMLTMLGSSMVVYATGGVDGSTPVAGTPVMDPADTTLFGSGSCETGAAGVYRRMARWSEMGYGVHLVGRRHATVETRLVPATDAEMRVDTSRTDFEAPDIVAERREGARGPRPETKMRREF